MATVLNEFKRNGGVVDLSSDFLSLLIVDIFVGPAVYKESIFASFLEVVFEFEIGSRKAKFNI